MIYAIGTYTGKNPMGHRVIEMSQCTAPMFNGMFWLTESPLSDSEVGNPFLVKFVPDDQFCTMISLESLKERGV